MAWNQLRQQNKFDVSFCIPNRGQVSYRFASRLVELEKPQSFMLNWDSGHQLDTARNMQVTRSLQLNAERVFFLDADIIPERNVLMRLIELDMPVASGVYFSRAPPYEIAARLDGIALPHDLAGRKETRRVTDVGMGCCLIDIRVFHRIGVNLPWRCMKNHDADLKKAVAKYGYKEAVRNGFRCGHCGGILIAPFFRTTIPYDDRDPLSEDYYFCRLAREAGFMIVIQLDALCKHEMASMVLQKEGLVNETKSMGES